MPSASPVSISVIRLRNHGSSLLDDNNSGIRGLCGGVGCDPSNDQPEIHCEQCPIHDENTIALKGHKPKSETKFKKALNSSRIETDGVMKW